MSTIYKIYMDHINSVFAKLSMTVGLSFIKGRHKDNVFNQMCRFFNVFIFQQQSQLKEVLEKSRATRSFSRIKKCPTPISPHIRSIGSSESSWKRSNKGSLVVLGKISVSAEFVAGSRYDIAVSVHQLPLTLTKLLEKILPHVLPKAVIGHWGYFCFDRKRKRVGNVWMVRQTVVWPQLGEIGLQLCRVLNHVREI